MLPVHLERDRITLGRLAVTLHRTLRIPDDGRDYPLPPSLGGFPALRVADHADRVPESWLAHGGIFVPMYQREAMWLSFDPEPWPPMAVKVAAGMVNAVSGAPWDERIEPGRDQDYLVVPPQPWLDGIKTGPERVRQFVAMPLGMGYTIEGQLSGEETFGGLQIVAFDPRPGRFPERDPAWDHDLVTLSQAIPAPPAGALGAEMGLAAGGSMRQKVYPDPHGPEAWDPGRTARLYVHIVNSQMFREITGRPAPESPVSARTYSEHGLPWFGLYDEHLGDVPAPDALWRVRTVREMDVANGFGPQQDDRPVAVPDEQVRRQAPAGDPGAVADGAW